MKYMGIHSSLAVMPLWNVVLDLWSLGKIVRAFTIHPYSGVLSRHGFRNPYTGSLPFPYSVRRL